MPCHINLPLQNQGNQVRSHLFHTHGRGNHRGDERSEAKQDGDRGDGAQHRDLVTEQPDSGGPARKAQ